MRLICESCDHGYTPTLHQCPYCGAGSHMAHTINIVSAMDTECYVNYWLCAFDSGEEFEMFDGHPLDISGLRKALTRYTVVSFNGLKYDMPMIAEALRGATCAELKATSDAMIRDGMQSWQLGIESPYGIDHIDMMLIAPGAGGLKAYGAKMHTRRLQDLPIEPGAIIGLFDRLKLREYCRNDLVLTHESYDYFPAQIQLRRDMSETYDIDLMCKSDAQIAEAIIRKLSGTKSNGEGIQPGRTFKYKIPEWIRFTDLDVLDVINSSVFTISDTGKVLMPDRLTNTIIIIAKGGYTIGMGGLHSNESGVTHLADEKNLLADFDVASYYPELIRKTGIEPPLLRGFFKGLYYGWIDDRLRSKGEVSRLKKEPKNDANVAEIKRQLSDSNSKKIILNGSFGKLGSPFSVLYAPDELIQVTITGQLALLMLIEMLEVAGIPVISANTDGIILHCPRNLEWLALDITQYWQDNTGFTLERTDYSAVYSRDVNSYVAVTLDGSVKRKGEAFAEPLPGPSGWPNPSGEICKEAMIAYLTKGTPLEDTIMACTDIKKFLHVRNVKGGGVLAKTEVQPKKTSIKHMVATVASDGWVEVYAKHWYDAKWDHDCTRILVLGEAYAEVTARHDDEYLGKVVRWYYGVNSISTILNSKSGNLVPLTNGCVPMMELVDTLPDDIDYQRYINKAQSLLVDVGYG